MQGQALILAKENRSWGDGRIAQALAELGYDISDQTVGNFFKRRGIPTASDRQQHDLAGQITCNRMA